MTSPKILSRLFLFLFIVIFLKQPLCGQNESRFWHFGNKAGLDFSTNPPISITNSSIITSEGCASISNAAGNLLFYTDGIKVFDANNAVMSNGTGLFGNGSSTQSAIIVKQPGNSNIYYVFTQAMQGSTQGLCYSLVDMNLAANMGSVTVKNTLVYTPSCEKITAVRHCNGIDVWIVSHEATGNNFRSYLLTGMGLSATPVISSAGFSVITNLQTIGQLKISPQGNKLGAVHFDTGVVEVLDFDPGNGIVSNALTLATGTSFYGCEFSPDGSKFYAGKYNSAQILQWDLCAGSPTAITSSLFSLTTISNTIRSLQLASNGKIYVARGNTTLSLIDNPNAAGAACNYTDNGLILSTGSALLGLPNFINSFFKVSPAPFTYSGTCATLTFQSTQQPGQAGAVCSSVSNSVQSLSWNFGHPQSGTANVSTGTLVTHTYSAAGTYTVKLAVNYQCNTDTVAQIVTVINVPAVYISAAGTLTLCNGEKRNITASGASTYLWSNGSTLTTVSLSPSVTTTYSVTGTSSAGCTASKIFTVTVNKCTDISQIRGESIITSIHPNPFNENIVVTCTGAAKLVIRNFQGQQLIEQNLIEGTNSVDTSSLAGGVYSMLLIPEQGPVVTKKILKIEGTITTP